MWAIYSCIADSLDLSGIGFYRALVGWRVCPRNCNFVLRLYWFMVV